MQNLLREALVQTISNSNLFASEKLQRKKKRHMSSNLLCGENVN